MRINIVIGHLALSLIGLTMLAGGTTFAQSLVPADVGQTVNGYQDDFEGSGMSTNWLATGTATGIYQVTNGILKVSSASGDPNHLLYAVAGYDDTIQEVLVRIRITNFGQGDPARAGVAVGVNFASSQGIDYHFRDSSSEGQSGRHTAFLDDLRAWGPGYSFTWNTNVWIWVRLRQEPNASTQGGVNDAFAKVWPADGSTPEPTAWQAWDYTPARSTRIGYAGITAGSKDGLSEFEVDYILIKAAGLPKIVVAPRAFNLTQTAVAITSQPQSQSILELFPVTFSVRATGNPIPNFQWFRNNQLIPSATNADYTIPSVALTDHGVVFKVVAANVVSNLACTATSTPATLIVFPDDYPPRLLSVTAMGLGQVKAGFSERLDPAAANDNTHYLITSADGTLPIFQAQLDPIQTNVLLQVSPMTEGTIYTLSVQGLTDQAAGRNRIESNSQMAFVAVSYQPQNIGNPLPLGNLVPIPGGYDMSAGGADIGGTADQFFFSALPQNGDFDVRVRLESLSALDPWAKAGLIVRESLNTNSAFAAVFGTFGNVGVFFQSRSSTGAASTSIGTFPVNYPATWLRLKRVGNVFTGFAGIDGTAWTQLGAVTMTLPSTVYLGYAVCGHGQGQMAAARFLDLSPVSAAVLSTSLPAIEPLGQSSRLTPFVISEIMYNPPKWGAKDLEFVELFNPFGTPEDISGYRLSGNIEYVFPGGTVLQPGGFLVVARNPVDLRSFYGITNVIGPYAGSLPNNGGSLELRHRKGAVFLSLKYDTSAPWPLSADGLGHSLVLARPSFGEGDPKAWTASDVMSGSPGRADSRGYEPLREVIINEFLVRGDAGLPAFIELYNHSNVPADISGCLLSNDKAGLISDASANVYRIPDKTVISPRGFVDFDQNQLDFVLNMAGDAIYLVNSNQTRVLDAISFTGQANGVSTGRFPDGGPDLYPLKKCTPGATNSAMLVRDIVINELMYNPISGDSADQYVELHNQGPSPIDVGNWKFTAGISFQIPLNTVIPSDGYLVIAKNATNLWAHYPGALNATNTVGNFDGTLAHKGERLVLSAPDYVLSTNQIGGVTTNVVWIDVDELTYAKGGRWGTLASGGGSSLELIDPHSDHRRASNWADSDETAKAPWTSVSFTGTLDNGDVAADALQVLLQGPGECLIDDVEVLNASGVNQIANSSFETGATGWTAEGTEQLSSLENSGGFNGGKCYHVRADDRGDNQVNRIRTPLKATLASGSTATIRAKVRWLKGHPEILFRLRGKWLEAVCQMTLPPNLGTPGARNSRAMSNAPPAIFDVVHSPVLPAAGESVVVTARVLDPDGVASATLNYRVDPAQTIRTVTMVDDGTGGDAVAGDGIYTATIPGQTAGTLVAFHVKATDGQTPPAISSFPNDAPSRECLVRFGEPVKPGNIPVYRLWITQATFNTWSSRSKLNNSLLDLTFVLGNHRVIYNAQGKFAGSAYIAGSFNTPSGNRCGYSITFPEDDLFLGSTDLVLDWPGGHGNENTGIQENMAYWMADQLNMPFSLRHYIRLIVNGVTDMQRGAVFEAVFQPNRDFVKAWSPDDPDGELYKIERGYEMSDAGGLVADPMPRLQNYTTTGGAKKTARYRWNWLKRSYDSANNFTNIFNLVDALNSTSPQPYTARTEQLMDIEECMRVFAFEHIINNFDSWGHEIGKNMFAYKPQNGKWQLYVIDLDWLMLVSPLYSGNYSGGNGSLFVSDDPTVTRMYNHPPFRRAYFRAVQDAVNGPLLSANCDPVMDVKYKWLVDNAVTMCDGKQLAGPAAVKQWFSDRRRFLQTQLTQVAANFNVSTPVATITNGNLVTLNGTAPVTVSAVEVNGVAYEPTWTTVTSFTMQVPLAISGTNVLRVQGWDPNGHAVTNANATLTVNYQRPSAPRLLELSISSLGEVTLIWSAQPAATYQLQYNDQLAAGVWLDLGPMITATTSTVATHDPRAVSGHRFYRVIQK